MSTLRLVLGDQLSTSIATLRDIDRQVDRVLMVEVNDEATYVPHHQQKLVLVLSAMRHFAAALREDGIRVDYVRLDSAANTGSFSGEVKRALQGCQYERLVVSEPGEWRIREMMKRWQKELGLPVEIREDDRFLCSIAEFAEWARGRKSLRMEYFYREMRRKTGWPPSPTPLRAPISTECRTIVPIAASARKRNSAQAPARSITFTGISWPATRNSSAPTRGWGWPTGIFSTSPKKKSKPSWNSLSNFSIILTIHEIS